MLRRNPNLTERVAAVVLERINNGTYPPESRLPSETDLATELAVSRATVRGALSQLSTDGLVRRQHGVGTFVRQSTQISNPLNEVVDYHDLITAQGFEFGFKHLGAVIKKPTPKIVAALKIKPESRVLEINKAFTADEELLIYTVNVIPEWVYGAHFSTEEITQPDATEPLFFVFLAERCEQPIDYFISNVRPNLAQNISYINSEIPVDPLLPVLEIEKVGYNNAEQPVLYELECLFGNRMKFELIRRLSSSLR